jgi:hypothetical protein
MTTRRGLLKNIPKIAAAVGLSGSVLVALNEAAEAGCYRKYLYDQCSGGNWYHLYRNCCQTYNGTYSCGSLQSEWFKSTGTGTCFL